MFFTCNHDRHTTTTTNTILLLLLFLPFSAPNSDEIQPLLTFKSSLTDPSPLFNWNASTTPCIPDSNWIGVLCSQGAVWGLQLESMNLSGTIDVDSLILLPGLRSISLTNNSFSGPLPRVNKFGALKSLFLSHNNFSGDIDDDAFADMNVLKKVYLKNNHFTGRIPTSLAQLPRLLELDLQDNNFEGQIPDFASTDLKMLNLSYNQLSGRIPESFNGFNSSSFAGNKDLCGVQVGKECPPSSSDTNMPMPKPSHSHPPSSAPLIITVTLVLVVILTIGFLIHRRRKSLQRSTDQPRQLPPEKVQKPLINGTSYTNVYYDNNNNPTQQQQAAYNNNNPSSTQQQQAYANRSLDRPSSYKKADNGKLCFLRTDVEKFEMQDLLKASAEVLGSGSFGSSYKAGLPSGPIMVVKRFRQMNNVGREELQEHMKKLGRLRHQNLLPIVAYFHKRDEKLLITEFVHNGSLASHLHSNLMRGQQGLSWPVRLRIIKGVARGLAYLYRELPQLTLPHGHLKSSNVLLDDNFEPLLSDYGLSPLMNKDHAEQVMVAFKSPEFTLENYTTKKTDVWCLGILILELLTGKFPANYLKHGKGASDDLATWVNSVAKEEYWSGGDLFDGEMKGTRNAEGEMLKLLKIGMWCCEWKEEKRWGLREAVEKIEELKERDTEEKFPPNSNSSGGDDDVRSKDDGDGGGSYSYPSSVALTSNDRLSFR